MSDNFVSLPLFSDAFYSYNIPLEGQSYTLEFMYNERTELYHLSLLITETREYIVRGIALVPDYPILADYQIEGLTGFIIMLSKADNDTQSYKTFPDKIDQYYELFYMYRTI